LYLPAKPATEIINPKKVAIKNKSRIEFMKDLVKFIARALVDYPDQVSVTEIGGKQTSVLELKVARTDTGKVIGKKGRTARAMRTILSAVSGKMKKRSLLEIIE